MEIKQAEAAIEAILFAMGDSVELEKIAKAIQQDTETTRKIIGHMMDGYRKKDRGIRIMELDGAYPVSYTHLDVYKRQADRRSAYPKMQIQPSVNKFAENCPYILLLCENGKIIYQKGIDEKKKYGIICCSAVKIPRQLYYAQSATGGRLGVRQCQMLS